jgi:hypothetical protein
LNWQPLKAAQLGIERACTFDQLLAMEDIVCALYAKLSPLFTVKSGFVSWKLTLFVKTFGKDLHETELVALAKETGLVNAVHFNLRYYPLVRQMKTMREKKAIWVMFTQLWLMLQDWLFIDYNWRLEPDKSGDSLVPLRTMARI